MALTLLNISFVKLALHETRLCHVSYILECRFLENVENMKYLGVTIIDDLKCNMCISNVCNKSKKYVK